MNIQIKEFDVENKIICGVLNVKENEKIGLDKLEDIFNYRLAGMVLFLNNQTVVDLDDNMQQLLTKIGKLNTIRNSVLVQEVNRIDEFLVNNHASHLWIKGIRDVLSDRKQIGLRKMIDSDLLVSKSVDIKAIMKEYGIRQGNVTMDGHLFYPKSNDEILAAEREHYEYVPYVKMLLINDEIPDDIPEQIMNRYRIFECNNHYYTDFVLDIHHALTTGFSFEEGLQDKRYPLMSKIDDLWYCMNKSYYEVIKGKKRDLQIVLTTIRKYRQSSIEIHDIAKRLKSLFPEIYNENVFSFYSNLIGADDETLDIFISKMRCR